VEVTDMMQRGHISIPNGVGLDYDNGDGKPIRRGVSTNDLTDVMRRDFLAGTPWHKNVPARVEKVRTASPAKEMEHQGSYWSGR